MQAAEKADVLNLHRGQETITSPTIGGGNSLPDQPLANLVLAAEIGMHPEATASELSKVMGSAWSDLPEDGRAPYEARFGRLQKAYKDDMATYLSKLRRDKFVDGDAEGSAGDDEDQDQDQDADEDEYGGDEFDDDEEFIDEDDEDEEYDDDDDDDDDDDEMLRALRAEFSSPLANYTAAFGHSLARPSSMPRSSAKGDSSPPNSNADPVCSRTLYVSTGYTALVEIADAKKPAT